LPFFVFSLIVGRPRIEPEGPFAWTDYYGRWGEKEKGYNNGPTGPQTAR